MSVRDADNDSDDDDEDSDDDEDDDDDVRRRLLFLSEIYVCTRRLYAPTAIASITSTLIPETFTFYTSARQRWRTSVVFWLDGSKERREPCNGRSGMTTEMN